MDKLFQFLDWFMETDVAKVIPLLRRNRKNPYTLAYAIIASIPLLWLLGCILAGSFRELWMKHLKKRGIYLKELPIREIVLRKSGRGLRIFFKIKKEHTRKAEEVTSGNAENKRRKERFFAGIIPELTKEEVCLIARSGSVNKKRWEGEIHKEDERDRSFRLDVGLSWEKKRNDEWLQGQKKLLNNCGEVIGVYGIDEETAKKGYEIYIPKAKEEYLQGMNQTELLRFCDGKNCKLQILERNSLFVCSEELGFTEKEVLAKIEAVAKEQGYKIKR